jgi:hypothetical protein
MIDVILMLRAEQCPADERVAQIMDSGSPMTATRDPAQLPA